MNRRRWVRGRPALVVVRVAAAATAIVRIAQAARRRPPLRPDGAGAAPSSSTPMLPSLSVVVPARNEARRLGPLLDALQAAPGVGEVVVVDDESTDDTAALAAAAGARVVRGAPLPTGWAGKAWALQQGLEAATGEWVVMLDADTRPSPHLPAALVARAVADDLDLVSVGGRFDCPTSGVAWLHPAMLTTLVYRFGPAGRRGRVHPARVLANGQCLAVPRLRFLAAGGMTSVAGHVVEDVALARHLATHGWQVVLLDGADLLSTQMFDDLGDTWRGWSRSLALPGVEPWWRQVADLGVLVVAQALPLPRLLVRRGDVLDAALLLMRLGTLVGTAGAYRRAGWAYWCSPLADVPAVAAVAAGVVSPRLGRPHRWRGRTYPSAAG